MNSAVVFTHCMPHREALASEELSPELASVMQHVVKVVNSIKARPKASHLFKVLCKDGDGGRAQTPAAAHRGAMVVAGKSACKGV